MKSPMENVDFYAKFGKVVAGERPVNPNTVLDSFTKIIAVCWQDTPEKRLLLLIFWFC